MAIENIPINSGTGPKVAVDLVGNTNYQVVKIMATADGATSALWTGGVTIASLPVLSATNVTIASLATGTVDIVSIPVLSATNVTVASLATGTVDVVAMPILSATNVTVASVATGTVDIANTPTVTASQGGAWNIATVSTVLGTVSVSGGGGGAQYPINTTAMGATATGTVVLGMQSGATTARGLILTTSGGIANIQVLATVSTLLGAVTVTATNVTVASLATGTVDVVAMPVLSATNVTVASLATGTVNVVNTVTVTGTVDNAVTVGTITTVLGVVAVSGGGGGAQYSAGATDMGATGTGSMIIGLQSGGTTGRAIVVTTTGALITSFVTTQAVTAANVTVASIATGTMNVVSMPVLSATNVTIASIATGTVTVKAITTGTVSIAGAIGTVSTVSTLLGTIAISGTVTAPFVTTTASHAIIGTAHASRFQAFVIATTSAGGGVIVRTSGAHTLYITDMLLSVDGPMNVTLASETTAMGIVYLATKGGFAKAYIQPLVCTTAQSLRVLLSSSGLCGVQAVGYTVT